MEATHTVGGHFQDKVRVTNQESKVVSDESSHERIALEATTMERKREAEVSEAGNGEKRLKVSVGSSLLGEEGEAQASVPRFPEAMQPLSNPSGVRAAAAVAVGMQVLQSGPADEPHCTKEDGNSEAAVHEAGENAVVAPGVVK